MPIDFKSSAPKPDQLCQHEIFTGKIQNVVCTQNSLSWRYHTPYILAEPLFTSKKVKLPQRTSFCLASIHLSSWCGSISELFPMADGWLSRWICTTMEIETFGEQNFDVKQWVNEQVLCLLVNLKGGIAYFLGTAEENDMIMTWISEGCKLGVFIFCISLDVCLWLYMLFFDNAHSWSFCPQILAFETAAAAVEGTASKSNTVDEQLSTLAVKLQLLNQVFFGRLVRESEKEHYQWAACLELLRKRETSYRPHHTSNAQGKHKGWHRRACII